MNLSLSELHQQGHLRLIDVQAGEYIQELSRGTVRERVALAAALVSRAVSAGHVCLPLQAVAEQMRNPGQCSIDSTGLEHILMESGVVAAPGEVAPLLLDQNSNLYLYRFYAYEQIIARGLLSRAAPRAETEQDSAQDTLSALFPEKEQKNLPDLQKKAAATGVSNNLLIVSGGPGTGKTFTAARILAAIGASSKTPLRVCLAAPTGKAASRLKESLIQARPQLSREFQAYIPEETHTIHRLLRFMPMEGRFLHDHSNKLHIDLLMVDEASMIDVPLMAALMEALPDHCRVVLLGDRNQLASVEAGNLFADICSLERGAQAAEMRQGMHDTVVELTRSYRFDSLSGIGQLAGAVLTGDVDNAVSCLGSGHNDLRHIPTASPRAAEKDFNAFIQRCFVPIFSCTTPQDALDLLDQSRILCALQQGENGVQGCNRQTAAYLMAADLVDRIEEPFHGMPILVQKNDYALNIFNGDAGILWQNDQGGLDAWFQGPKNTYLSYPLQQLPAYEQAFAITVHKSQGSEYDQVLFVLPAGESPLLGRELLYTGITRAKKQLILFAETAVFSQGTRRSVKRFSGLADALRRGAIT